MKFLNWFQKKKTASTVATPVSYNITGPKRIGDAVLRDEDLKLITGRGQYVDDIDIGPHLILTFVRSSIANGLIKELDVSEARVTEGVFHIFTADDTASLGKLAVNPVLETMQDCPYPILAKDMVHTVGEPVAAILSTSSAAGLDASELVHLEITPLEGTKSQLAMASLEESVISQTWNVGNYSDERLEEANYTVSTKVEHPRLAPSPMENRAIAVKFHEENESVTVYLSTQTPHRAKSELARIINIPADKISVITHDVGGAFGMKASLYPEEVMAVWAAFQTKQSVKWISTRNEDLLSATHGRGLQTEGTLTFDATGKFIALKAKVTAPLGHWLPNSAAIPAWNAARMLPGPYDIPDLHIETRGVSLNTAPVGIYRGAGRPEAITLMEKLVDLAARKIDMDPVEIRRLNLISEAALPKKSETGANLDSGNYVALLDNLIEKTDYVNLKSRIENETDPNSLKGIGVSFYVEPCGKGWESARVTLHPNGSISAKSGSSSQGHGRSTAFRQILSDLFEADISKISLEFGNTETCPEGIGALASRSTSIGGSALLKAGQEVLKKAKEKPNHTEDITVDLVYENDGEAWGYGAYLTEVSIDRLTGQLSVDQITCIDDAGKIINPMMVEGQIMGGIAQGVGEALMEQVLYSDDGQLITGSLMDYALPRASDMPALSISKTETPSPNNLLGAKGVGEAGTIAAPVSILNATYHALRDFDVQNLQMPLTSEKIWRAMQRKTKD
ncbi:molybdopterin-dependent oxidoreductase [Sneathiella sp. P13V-1]|uniref:xanthine dehydrogenase family protein molybdopterin-binding subunit n=1 Tax=Sneathiella sp. P13V-1 TaxID=2697366 RepID=UPI00187B3A82|nr:xanthine dehydrogenase family protein molybdopterin-binding subunit [Sneathiella sp. P13V-1]MBE7637743.1 molybdopterin-dependent oxidoreductase [Sneathiella sp. P13V-1]